MPALYKKYKDFKYGVVNAIETTELPLEAVYLSQNMYYRENWWRKVPGLVEINPTQIGGDPVWSLFRFHQPISKKNFLIAASGTNLYKYNESSRAFESIQSQLFPNDRIEFLEVDEFLYFGSQNNRWRRYDGGAVTYQVGVSEPPKKFIRIIFNPYSGRFFGVGDPENPDLLYWSDHIDDGGIENWPDGNVQSILSVNGDFPIWEELFEGRISLFSKYSINSGTVVGSPETWSFEREKTKAGTISGRTVKRYGSSFIMLTPNYEVYVWPDDKFITKGKIKFNIDPNFAHLACAEIVDDRYYYLCFKSGEGKGEQYTQFGVSKTTPLTERYHLWIYDILGDRWYGPHIQYSLSSMYWDRDNNILLTGGIEELAGFVMEHRGKDIKNKASKVHWVSSFSDFGEPHIDKRFTKIWLKARHEGTKPGGEGQVQLRINTDGTFGFPQDQLVTLVDTSTPDNLIRDTSTSTREAITKRGYIHEQYGRGTNVLVEMFHEYSKGDFSFSEFELEYYKKYAKENRAV